MRTFIFLSTDDLIEQLVNDDDDDDSSIEDLGPQTSQEYFKGIYSESMEEIKKYHTDYPYLVKTKKFGCYIL
jgi:hypothetical protein